MSGSPAHARVSCRCGLRPPGRAHAADGEELRDLGRGGARAFVRPPFTLSGAPAIMVLALLLMHVVAAVVVTGGLTALATRDG